MQGQFWLVKDRRDLDQAIDNFKSYIINDWDFKKPLTWQPKEYKSVRSISQNALFHMWVREITEHFISRGGNVEWTTEENVKLYIKQQFLGFEDIRNAKNGFVNDELKYGAKETEDVVEENDTKSDELNK